MPFLGFPVSPGGVGVGPGVFSVASGPTLLFGVASEDSVASRRPLGLSLAIEGFLSSAKYLCSWSSANAYQLIMPASRPGAPMEKTHPRDSYPRAREDGPPNGRGAAQRPHGSKRRPQHEEPFGGESGGNWGVLRVAMPLRPWLMGRSDRIDIVVNISRGAGGKIGGGEASGN